VAAAEPGGAGVVDAPHEPATTPTLPDGLRPRIPLGTWGSLRPTLLAQLRTELDHPLHGGGDTTATARLATLRVGAALSLAGDRLRLQGRVSLAPGHLELVDVYADVVASEQATLRAGIAKVPFTRYRLQSTSQIAPVTSAVTTRWFGAERQLGVQVQNGWSERVHYAAGVFTGENTRASHAVGLAELYGATPRDPSSLVDPDPRLHVHPELVAMVGYDSPGMGAPVSVERRGSPWKVAVALSAAVDTRPDPEADLASRLAPEVELRGHRIVARGVLYAGWFAPRDGHGPWRVGALGGLAEVTWSAHRWIDLFARWAGVWWTPALATSAGIAPGATQEVGGGLIVPVIGDQLKWTTDLRWTHEGPRATARDELVWRTQLQLAF
jgi:hypothetical protein